MHTPEVPLTQLEHVICVIWIGVGFGVGVCWFLVCLRPVSTCAFHLIAKTTLFNGEDTSEASGVHWFSLWDLVLGASVCVCGFCHRSCVRTKQLTVILFGWMQR